jgi:hypothetical protein
MINFDIYWIKSNIQKAFLGIFLGLSFSTFAQQKEVVKEVLGQKNYANTTEVHKKEATSDAQVLADLDGNFGIGDEVRITIAPPPKKTDTLAKKSAKSLDFVSNPPAIPESDAAIQVTSKHVETPPNTVSEGAKSTEVVAQKTAPKVAESSKSRVNTEGVSSSKSNRTATSSKSSKGFYTYSKSSRSERFLFFFKKKPSKPSVTYHNKDSKKYGCYRF